MRETKLYILTEEEYDPIPTGDVTDNIEVAEAWKASKPSHRSYRECTRIIETVEEMRSVIDALRW